MSQFHKKLDLAINAMAKLIDEYIKIIKDVQRLSERITEAKQQLKDAVDEYAQSN